MVERGGVVFEGFEELDARWLWLLGGSLVRLDGDLRPSALYFAANFCYLPTRVHSGAKDRYLGIHATIEGRHSTVSSV